MYRGPVFTVFVVRVLFTSSLSYSAAYRHLLKLLLVNVRYDKLRVDYHKFLGFSLLGFYWGKYPCLQTILLCPCIGLSHVWV
jgi:hypothetical protein